MKRLDFDVIFNRITYRVRAVEMDKKKLNMRDIFDKKKFYARITLCVRVVEMYKFLGIVNIVFFLMKITLCALSVTLVYLVCAYGGNATLRTCVCMARPSAAGKTEKKKSNPSAHV